MIPTLCLDNLPEYETSSDEDAENDQQNLQYPPGYFDLSSQGELAKPKLKDHMLSYSNKCSSSLDLKISQSSN